MCEKQYTYYLYIYIKLYFKKQLNNTFYDKSIVYCLKNRKSSIYTIMRLVQREISVNKGFTERQ